MNLETAKILGGVGALLMFVGIVPYISFYGILELVGLILVLISLSSLGSHFAERGIFNNALYGVIIGIVGGVISVAAVIFTVLTSLTSFLHTIYPNWNGDWTALSGLTPNPSNFNFANLMPFITGILTVFVILWIFSIISAFFVRRSLVTLAAKSGIGLFSTAGLLLLIGAVLTVIVIGVILIWISALLLAIAFFRIRTQPQQPIAPPTPTPPV